MKYSVRKISELTGFSPATVSNALNYKRGVNKQTSEEILRVAREVGYSAAAKITSIRFLIYKRDGMVVEDNPFFSAMIESVERACREQNYDMAICNISQLEEGYENRLMEIIDDPNTAILLLATELTKSDMVIFTKTRAPIVVIDAWFDDLVFDTVLVNNEDSVRLAVNHLINSGHTDIGYLSGRFRTRNFIDRGRGYRRSLMEKKITIKNEYRVTLTPTMDGAYRDMCVYLGKGPQLPTAFFADNDFIALGAMKAMKQFGYKIPEDISIVGFDDMPFSEMFSPALSTIKFFQKEMGRLGVERLVDKIRKPDLINVRTQISTQLMKRESVLDITKIKI